MSRKKYSKVLGIVGQKLEKDVADELGWYGFPVKTTWNGLSQYSPFDILLGGVLKIQCEERSNPIGQYKTIRVPHKSLSFDVYVARYKEEYFCTSYADISTSPLKKSKNSYNDNPELFYEVPRSRWFSMNLDELGRFLYRSFEEKVKNLGK